jgi:hypothetical protein
MNAKNKNGLADGRAVAPNSGLQCPQGVRSWPILLQKSFFAADQNFSGQLTRFLSKYVRDLIPW